MGGDSRQVGGDFLAKPLDPEFPPQHRTDNPEWPGTAFSAGNGFVKNPKLGFLALNDKNSKYINLDGCYRY